MRLEDLQRQYDLDPSPDVVLELAHALDRDGRPWEQAELLRQHPLSIFLPLLRAQIDRYWRRGQWRIQNRFAQAVVRIYESSSWARQDPETAQRDLRWMYEIARESGDTILGTRVLLQVPDRQGFYRLARQWWAGYHGLRPARALCVIACAMHVRDTGELPTPQDVIEVAEAILWEMPVTLGSGWLQRSGRYWQEPTRERIQIELDTDDFRVIDGRVLPKWKSFKLGKLLPRESVRDHHKCPWPWLPLYEFSPISFSRVSFPVVRRVFPMAGGLFGLAQDLVAVQPMSSPVGLTFFLDYMSHNGADVPEDAMED